MNNEQYSALCRHICTALDIPDPDSLSNEGSIFVDEIKIQLMFDDLLSDDCILCVVDIGEIPKDIQPQVSESLLKLNFLTGSKTVGAYAIDPLSQHAVFVVTLIHPDALKADDLADLFRRYAHRSRHLQSTLLKSGELILPLDAPAKDPAEADLSIDLA